MGAGGLCTRLPGLPIPEEPGNSSCRVGSWIYYLCPGRGQWLGGGCATWEIAWIDDLRLQFNMTLGESLTNRGGKNGLSNRAAFPLESWLFFHCSGCQLTNSNAASFASGVTPTPGC